MTAAAIDSLPGIDEHGARALEAVLADPAEPRLVFQPIADLRRGVVAGYECLSRFSAEPYEPPDVWFRRAAAQGAGIELELRALQAALEARATLPDNTFLTVNLSPGALASSAIRPILRSAGTLSRLVVEITEHSVVTDYRSLAEAVSAVRREGGLVAVDDAGAGYASLRHVLELRPDFVKLDRSFVSHIDGDPAMIAVVQMLGEFASRLDSWIIAEGIERIEELDVLASLQVPLGQGFLLGAPAPPWSILREAHRERLPARAAEEDAEGVAALAERRPCVPPHSDDRTIRETFAACPGARHLVQVDSARRPVGLLRREGGVAAEPYRPLIVSPLTTLRDAAWRAVQRPAEQRFDPLVCTTANGEYFGIIAIERLLTALAR